ncbi:MAG: hypothetical protein ACREBC_22060 [Pyrinomonadaceae bacterium]
MGEQHLHPEILLRLDEYRLGTAEGGHGVWLVTVENPGETPAPAGNQKVGISIMIFSPTMSVVTEL